MSGRKQHFIPQSLLRGFAKDGTGKPQVVAYTRERGIFTPPADGIAAQRNFYSKLSLDDGAETLDDRITAYETLFAGKLKRLRELNDGATADTAIAAEIVTHLIVRNDHSRKSMTAMGTDLFAQLGADLLQERMAWNFLGLGNPAGPANALTTELDKLWTQYGFQLRSQGIHNREQFQTLALEFSRQRFPEAHAEMLQTIKGFSAIILEQLPDLASKGQREALLKGIVPEKSVEKLEAFAWRVEHVTYGLILPDCIAITIDEDRVPLPLLIGDLESVPYVAMPLASARLLVGTKRGYSFPAVDLNQAFASCSWDFFVAKDRSDTLGKLVPIIRTRVTEFMNETIREVLDESLGRALAT